jgi:hypothetical protein
MPFVILPTNSASGGYDITNSLRFNSGSSDYLNRTPASSGNRQKWTWSGWFKKAVIGSGAYEYLFNCTDAINSTGRINNINNTTDSFQFADDLISADLRTTAVYRDSSAWYHLVVAMDTTQATASNRIKMYVNGSQITSFSTETYPSQNSNGTINLVSGSYVHRIGTYSGSGSFFNGYQSEVYFIDGQQLTPSSFGETDFDTGIWKPKAFSGSYGTNGFYLQFKNSASLGTDSSGNGNTFTVNNLTSIDQTTDTPTNNFATWNPLDNYYPASTFTEGNTKIVTGASQYSVNVATMGVSSGKWYWEVKVDSSSGYNGIGIASNQSASASQLGKLQYDYSYYSYATNVVTTNNAVISGLTTSTYTTGDIIGVALDLTNNLLYFYKNGTVQNGGTGISIASPSSTILGNYFPAVSDYDSVASGTYSINTGNPNYTGGSYTDGAGYGNFSYAVPSGYYSLNTKNLANFG